MWKDAMKTRGVLEKPVLIYFLNLQILVAKKQDKTYLQKAC